MKWYGFTSLFVLACACTNERVESEVESDAFQHVYDTNDVIPGTDHAPLDLDTTRMERLVAIGNEKYPLRITSYSLNDSSVINSYHDGTAAVEHDRAFRIVLEGYSGSDRAVVLDKATFRDSLATDFFQRARLYLVDDVFVRSNALYFSAYVGVPETDHVAKFHAQWFFRGPRTGTLRYIGPEFARANE